MTDKKKIFKKFVTNPLSLIGIFILLFFVTVAVFAPFIAPPKDGDEPYMIPRVGWGSEPQAPTSEHVFGTTEGQYDIFYGLVWGTRTAFRMGFIITFSCAFIGVIFGSVSAYKGGVVDEIMMRTCDIFMSIPFIVAAMVFTTILGKGLNNVMIAMVTFGWMTYARLIRGQVLQVKQSEFVEAARALGVKEWKILLKHVLPNAIYPVVIQASMSVGSMVVWAAALSFLGVGSELGYADWGQMISFARNWIVGAGDNPLQYWYTVVYPGMAIVLFSLAWNLLGDAFRDVMDPKLQN